MNDQELERIAEAIYFAATELQNVAPKSYAITVLDEARKMVSALQERERQLQKSLEESQANVRVGAEDSSDERPYNGALADVMLAEGDFEGLAHEVSRPSAKNPPPQTNDSPEEARGSALGEKEER